MAHYWLVFALHLLFLFAFVYLVAAIDLRRKQRATTILDEAGQPVDAYYFPAPLWYLFYRWTEFLGSILGPWAVLSTMGANVFLNQTKTLTEQLYEYSLFVILPFAWLTIPIMAVRHCFGARVGFRLHLYPEFAITPTRLYYRFFSKWHWVALDTIRAVVPIPNDFKQTCGYTLHLRAPVGIPTYSFWPPWRRTYTAYLIVYCLLPNVPLLKELIEHYHRVQTGYPADSTIN